MSKLEEKIDCLFSKRPFPYSEIAVELAFASLSANCCDFPLVVELANMDEMNDDYVQTSALAALPGWGEKGIDQLLKFAFEDAYKNKTSNRAIEVLLAISQQISPSSSCIAFLHSSWDSQRKYSITKELAKYSLHGLRAGLINAFNDEYGRSKILFILGQMGLVSCFKDSAKKEGLDFFLALIVDNHLLLNSAIINRFETLLDSEPANEEQLQKFFTEHPVLLDPFVNVLFSKQELGSDFITDYVVKQMNNHYVLVEIENSTDKLFKNDGNFSSKLTAAIAQVRDFQAWVSDNLSYAQKKLPSIKHPAGLVVIGRKKNLTDLEIKRLNEENYSRRGHIKIVTYDDLLDTAKSVYKNFIERPSILTSKMTKCI